MKYQIPFRLGNKKLWEMKLFKRYILIALLLSTTNIRAQDIPDPMSPPRLVNDFAGLLSQDENSILEKKLRDYNDTTSTQIYVVTVKDLLGYDPADFAVRLGRKWEVGQKGKNNGIVILIKPKIGNENGRAYIATGYGMEDIIPDAIANRIVNLEMIPFFKEDSYFAGIEAGLKIIFDLAAGRYTAEQYAKKESPISGVIIFIIIIIILSLIFSSNNRNKGKTLGSNLPFWIAMGMLSNRGGGFGNFSSGSGSFGGFGGGGFGGGGGGSFGGGGAGGSW